MSFIETDADDGSYDFSHIQQSDLGNCHVLKSYPDCVIEEHAIVHPNIFRKSELLYWFYLSKL